MAKHKKREDRRVGRTKVALQQALFHLILEKGFESVSVQDITERANVGRSTFYAHFTSKADLLLVGFDYWEKRGLELLHKEGNAGGPLRDRVFCFSPLLLEHIHAHGGPLYRAMAGKESGAMVLSRLRQSLTTLLREELGTSRGARDKVSFNAMIHFVVGAFLGLVGWWLDNPSHLSPGDMDKLFRRLALPAVEAELGRKF